MSENIRFYIKQFTDLVTIALLNKKENIMSLFSKLKVKALSYLQNSHSLQNESKFDQACSLLINKFETGKSLTQKHNKFTKIIQKQGVSIRDLANEITSGIHYLLNTRENNQEVLEINNGEGKMK